MPNGRCYRHGGATPHGPASPHWKKGKHSAWFKLLKGDLKAGFAAAQRDNELAGLRDVLDLQRGFIYQLLKKLKEANSPPWGKVVDAFNDWKFAKDDEPKAQALVALESLIRTGADTARAEASIRAEIRELAQEHTRTAAAEWKRITDLKAVLTAEQAVGFADALVRAAEEHIPDKKGLAAFYEKTLALVGSSVPKRVEATVEESDAG
jgi:hypothetical protein